MEQTTIESLESRALLVGNASGVITGTAFLDADSDGHLDATPTDTTNEIKLPGVTLTLSGTTTTNTTVSGKTVKTKSDGTFTFLNVLPGTYTITARPADNSNVVRADVTVANLTVTGGQTVTRNFAFAGDAAAQFLSIRAFRTNATTADQQFAFSAAGTTDGKATDRENNLPTLLNGTPDEINVAKNADNQVIDLAGVFDDPDMTDSLIRFKTTVGSSTVAANNRDIDVTLLDTQAPQTVANFFNYITSNRFDNTFFHRLVDDFVLQGGGFTFNDTANTITRVEKDDPVENEFDGTNRSNIRGTLAMAKSPGDPNSATNEFFFNLGNNVGTSPNGLNFQNGGFTVFGRVETGSLDEMDALANTTIRDQSNTNSALNEIPLNSYSGPNDDPAFLTTASPNNFVRLNDVEIIRRDEFLTYSLVSNTNSTLVTATIENNRLFLNYADEMTGTAAITVRATDKFGATLDTTFQVEVANSAPVATVTLTPQNPTTSGTLTANATRTDADGDDVTLTYNWTVNGTSVKTTNNSTATSAQLQLSQVAGGVDPGDIVRVEVTPNDGTINGTAQTATTLVNTPPQIDSLTLSDTTPGTNETLTATVTRSDVNNHAVTLDYIWRVNGTVVKTTSDSTSLTDSLNLATANQGDLGDNITVEVTPNDGREDGAPATTSAVVSNTAPSVTVTFSQLDPPPNAVLQANVVANEPDAGQALSFTYEWRVNNVAVQGPTVKTALFDTLDLSTLTLSRGDNVTVLVTPNDGTESGSTEVAATVINRLPVVNSVLLNFATPTTNQSLTATVIASDPDTDTVKLTYVWKVNGSTVQTTAATTSLTDSLNLAAVGQGDVGDNITVEVTPNDSKENGTTVMQAATVANTAPSVTLALTPTNPTASSVMQVNVTVTDPDATQTVTLTYVWKVNGSTVQGPTSKSNLFDTLDLSTLTINPTDVVTVEVTPNDGLVDGTLQSAQRTIS